MRSFQKFALPVLLVLCSLIASAGTVTDIDGNVYQTVVIGTQIWMAENLKVTHYRNGEPIPNVTDDGEWANFVSGGYCEYNNDLNNVGIYGRLYNWYAVGDSRNIAPSGWHVPTDDEWQTLVNYLGGDAVAGGKLKETGTTHWCSPNTDATNESGFTAMPGGYRFLSGIFENMGNAAVFWSSTKFNNACPWYRYLECNNSEVGRDWVGVECYGLSVRCVKDAIDSDGDGIIDDFDNCPAAYNPGQEDGDSDAFGDACDICPGFDDNIDTDVDGIPDGCDICEGFDDNADTDGDNVPDGCDICMGHDDNLDNDVDGIPDGCDNCPNNPNPGQEDGDSDAFGDACDLCPGEDDNFDTDDDGIPDGCDICPGFDDNADADGDNVPDGCDICPGFDDNLDIDSDSFPDDCDNCPTIYNVSQDDSDEDGIGNICDNCPDNPNPDQADTDGDNIGDVCDWICGDANSDDKVDILDIVYLINYKYKTGPAPESTEAADVNHDGKVDILDIVYLINYKYKAGPEPDCL